MNDQLSCCKAKRQFINTEKGKTAQVTPKGQHLDGGGCVRNSFWPREEAQGGKAQGENPVGGGGKKGIKGNFDQMPNTFPWKTRETSVTQDEKRGGREAGSPPGKKGEEKRMGHGKWYEKGQ